MSRPKTEGFQKPVRTTKTKPVRIAVMKDNPEVGLAECSCGWTYPHPRRKVREEASDKHLTRKHGGTGVWL